MKTQQTTYRQEFHRLGEETSLVTPTGLYMEHPITIRQLDPDITVILDSGDG